MYSTFHRALSISLFCFFFLSASCYAAPNPHTFYKIFHRDGTLSGVQTLTTTQRIPTEAGVFIETCNIVTTPITGDNGENLVREERSCRVSMDTGSSGTSPIVTPSSTTGDGGVSSLPVVTLTSTSATGGVSSSPSANPPAGVSVGGVSSVPNPGFTGSPSPTQSGGSSVITPSSSGTSTSSSGSGTNASGLSSSTSANPTAVGAAADSASETPFDPPGKQLQVLPIGLGIFAGISVIAIIIVGVVTYERTKHRKNFRRQKLAEAGASMGYGGLAQAA